MRRSEASFRRREGREPGETGFEKRRMSAVLRWPGRYFAAHWTVKGGGRVGEDAVTSKGRRRPSGPGAAGRGDPGVLE